MPEINLMTPDAVLRTLCLDEIINTEETFAYLVSEGLPVRYPFFKDQPLVVQSELEEWLKVRLADPDLQARSEACKREQFQKQRASDGYALAY